MMVVRIGTGQDFGIVKMIISRDIKAGNGYEYQEIKR
jgi:hypothetical protein